MTNSDACTTKVVQNWLQLPIADRTRVVNRKDLFHSVPAGTLLQFVQNRQSHLRQTSNRVAYIDYQVFLQEHFSTHLQNSMHESFRGFKAFMTDHIVFLLDTSF